MEYAQAGYLSGSSCDLQVLCNGHVHMVPTNDDTPLNGRQISFLVRYLRLCRSERHSSTTSKSSYAPKDPIKALETVWGDIPSIVLFFVKSSSNDNITYHNIIA